MKLTVLGSGTSIPTKERGSSGYLLEVEDKLILLDCGNGIIWKLEKIGIRYLDIDHIFITHFHPDHTSDLITFFFATKNPFDKIRNKPLKICGPFGLSEFISRLLSAYGKWSKPDYLEVIEFESDKWNFSDFEVKIFKTLHTHNSLGYIISDHNKRLVYTGDTGYFPELSEFTKNCDLLVIECSVPNRLKYSKHLCPAEIIKIISDSKPNQVLLTHIYPGTDKQIQKEIKDADFKDCNIVLAEDFMEFYL